MESLQALKSRLRAVNNIGQITKAMEVVSATKMRRAQEVALNSRPYAFEALRLLERVSRGASPTSNGANGRAAIPLAETRLIQKTLVVVVSSDRGLAGSFNAQVFRAADAFLANNRQNGKFGHSYILATIGKKAGAYAAKRGFEIAAKFHDWSDHAEPEEVEPLMRLAVDGFLENRWDRVVTISTHFRTTLKQEVLIRQILPVDFEKIRETAAEIVPERGRWANPQTQIRGGSTSINGGVEYIFEPSPAEALNALIPHLVKMQFYHLVLEANASEHSARMVAMKNASDNAEDLSGKITLDYNKARQASITKEIIEITSTQSAMA